MLVHWLLLVIDFPSAIFTCCSSFLVLWCLALLCLISILLSGVLWLCCSLCFPLFFVVLCVYEFFIIRVLLFLCFYACFIVFLVLWRGPCKGFLFQGAEQRIQTTVQTTQIQTTVKNDPNTHLSALILWNSLGRLHMLPRHPAPSLSLILYSLASPGRRSSHRDA